MPHNQRPAKWKSDSDDRPRNGGVPLSAGSLTVGLRVVYLGKKANSLPMVGKNSLKLDSEQHRMVSNDLMRLERPLLGAVLPRKTDVQLCPFIAGAVDVVWPELEKGSMRFEKVLSGMKSLRRVPERELSYLAMCVYFLICRDELPLNCKRRSCLIMYILPPALTSLDRQQPWDAPCAIVSESCAVDKGLEALCRAALVEEPLLEQDKPEESNTRSGRERLPSSALSVASSSTRTTSPPRVGPPDRARSRTPPPGRRRSRSPPRSRTARQERRRIAAFSPPPTHFTPGKASLPPKPSIPTAPRGWRDAEEHSPARARSPPRKRPRVESPDVDTVTVRWGVEARELEEQVRRLESECSEAHDRERTLCRELIALRERSDTGEVLMKDVDVWKRKAEEAEDRLRARRRRLRACLADPDDGATVECDDEGILEELEQLVHNLHSRASAAVQGADSLRVHHEGILQSSPDVPCPGPSVVDAWCKLSEMVRTLCE
ncbi:unnamed protein product [Peniophora sp. CBMAI 1063]|nr:unnamed protein product [Peniophora sp. CBMAI 1063]